MTATRPRRPISSEPVEPPKPSLRSRLAGIRIPKPPLPKLRRPTFPSVSLPKISVGGLGDSSAAPQKSRPAADTGPSGNPGSSGNTGPSGKPGPSGAPDPAKRELPKLRVPRVALPDITLPKVVRPTPLTEAPDDVHPRIQLRRVDVAEEQRRRRSRGRIAVLVILGLLTLGVASLFSPFVDLDELAVTGVEGAPSDLVTEASGLAPGTALFGIRPVEVRDRIEDLAWVSHATVDVEWPDTVAVAVTPQRPVAMVATGDGPADRMALGTGRIAPLDAVEPLVPFTEGLLTLRLGGPVGGDGGIPASEVRSAIAAIDRLGPASAALLGEAVLDADGALQFSATGGPVEGATVSVGPLVDLPAKLQAIEAALGGAIDLSCLARLEVSVPSRLTLSRVPECTLPDIADAPAGAAAEDR